MLKKSKFSALTSSSFFVQIDQGCASSVPGDHGQSKSALHLSLSTHNHVFPPRNGAKQRQSPFASLIIPANFLLLYALQSRLVVCPVCHGAVCRTLHVVWSADLGASCPWQFPELQTTQSKRPKRPTVGTPLWSFRRDSVSWNECHHCAHVNNSDDRQWYPILPFCYVYLLYLLRIKLFRRLFRYCCGS